MGKEITVIKKLKSKSINIDLYNISQVSRMFIPTSYTVGYSYPKVSLLYIHINSCSQNAWVKKRTCWKQ